MTDADSSGVPVIDLGLDPSQDSSTVQPSPAIIDAVAHAAEHHGFFQVVNHGVDPALIDAMWDQTTAFFALPTEVKRRILRSRENTRGYYDRELTKNKRDQKEVFDLGRVPFPELGPDDPRNHHAVDGRNQWPDLPGFRSTMIDYLAACEQLSLHLLGAFTAGLGESATYLHEHFGTDHTSAMRLNHYPTADVLAPDEAADETPLGDMALHHHSDAGALTLLLQDNVGGLQVERNGVWIDVEPLAGAIVVNTGDMMQVWSNDRYQAALHRVSQRTTDERYSIPYFFNPSYSTVYEPLPGSVRPGDTPHYRPIRWADFRQGRADGDFADYGAEIQITDFRIDA